jgi:type II restriction/modification system DNA methylase subunit YeeA
LGAHYTSKDDIQLIVEPVLMAPLRREWEQIKQQGIDLSQRRDSASTPQLRSRYHNELDRLINGFTQRLATVRVLDPACGSGNFLYVALRMLLDLWKEVAIFAGTLGLPFMLPLPGFAPAPEQLYGIELNEYAYELAQATVWIGYIQWLHENGYGVPSEPILKPLNNIKHMDAILAYDADGKPVEPEWPLADVIIGNPPFLGGGHRMRAEIGDYYTDQLFALYSNRVPSGADLVCYWFEKAREMIQAHSAKRAGLIATNSIRGGANRRVLERIKETGGLFMAWEDRPWTIEGADVRVSIVGFDDGSQQEYALNGQSVQKINSDLTASLDTTNAIRLLENSEIAYRGDTKGGAFDIPGEVASKMLAAPINPNGKYNSEVVRPWVNGLDIARRPRHMWLIDFGVNMSEEEAALYEVPYEYVRQRVLPERLKSKREAYRERWWIHMEARPGLRRATENLRRYIVTPAVSRHRFFVWLTHPTMPDQQLIVIAREDDYTFGILHSKVHELWSLRMGTRLGVGNDPRYTPTTCFETFPFPWPPGQEPADDPMVQATAQAAKELVEKRDNWLNPSGISDVELKKRTLTNLYNQRPTWLDLAHKKLDRAVLAAYGWSDLLTDDGINEDELLARLLALNLERSKAQPEAQPSLIEDDTDEDE